MRAMWAELNYRVSWEFSLLGERLGSDHVGKRSSVAVHPSYDLVLFLSF